MPIIHSSAAFSNIIYKNANEVANGIRRILFLLVSISLSQSFLFFFFSFNCTGCVTRVTQPAVPILSEAEKMVQRGLFSYDPVLSFFLSSLFL